MSPEELNLRGFFEINILKEHLFGLAILPSPQPSFGRTALKNRTTHPNVEQSQGMKVEGSKV
jgi:hypothetical protein